LIPVDDCGELSPIIGNFPIAIGNCLIQRFDAPLRSRKFSFGLFQRGVRCGCGCRLLQFLAPFADQLHGGIPPGDVLPATLAGVIQFALHIRGRVALPQSQHVGFPFADQEQFSRVFTQLRRQRRVAHETHRRSFIDREFSRNAQWRGQTVNGATAPAHHEPCAGVDAAIAKHARRC